MDGSPAAAKFANEIFFIIYLSTKDRGVHLKFYYVRIAC